MDAPSKPSATSPFKRASVSSTGLTTEERIVDAARRLFFEVGFAGVSTDRLATEASVSKTSIYRKFGDMSGVLEAVVKAEGDNFFEGVEVQAATRAEYTAALIAYGVNLLKLLNRMEIIQFDQLMHEQARTHPDAARRFYDMAYGRSHADMTELLSYGQSKGFIRSTADPSDLADNLLSMWDGLRFVRARLGLGSEPFPDPHQWSAHCVGILLGAQEI
ncbi:MAG: TetR/AcrR family transcriptional regulator [Litorimonas sp.]